MIILAQTSDKQYEVKVTGQSADVVTKCQQFQTWLDNFDHDKMELRMISIQSADIADTFGGGKVIFVKMETEVYDRKTGKPIPGIVFLRGNAVAVLCLVVCKETQEIYTLLTIQPRVPLGRHDFMETVAGMLDKSDGLVGRTVAEIKEETSITIDPDELQYLGKWAPSAGGCDEKLLSFLVVKELSQQKIDEVLSKTHGLAAENETITIRMYTLNDFVEQISKDDQVGDAKILSTLALLMLRDNSNAMLKMLEKNAKKSKIIIDQT